MASATESSVPATASPLSEGVVVRRARAADAGALHDLAAATFPLACPPGTLRRDMDAFVAAHLSREKMTGYLADPHRELLLAEVDGAVAGYTMLIFGEPADADVSAVITVRPTVELSKLYVHSGHHGSGIAQRLVEASLGRALRRGARGVWLGVNQLNGRANAFYEKSGFALVGTKRFLVGSRFEDDFVRELRFETWPTPRRP